MFKHQKTLSEIGLQPSATISENRLFFIVNEKNKHLTIDEKDNVEFKVNENGSRFRLIRQDDESFQIQDTKTNLCLDIWDSASPEIRLHKCNKSANQRWAIGCNNLWPRNSAKKFEQQFGSLTLVPVPFTLLSFNLGYNIVLNNIDGSEAHFVLDCQKKYSATKGKSDIKNVSQCTKNAIDAIVKMHSEFKEREGNGFCFIGLQECPSASTVNYLVAQIPDKMEVFSSSGEVHLLSNVDQVGRGQQITPSAFGTLNNPSRPFVAVWFPFVSTIAISLHADHLAGSKTNIVSRFNEFFAQLDSLFEKNISQSIKVVKTVVIMGDFNAELANSTLFAFGHTLQVYAAKAKHLSCCYGGGYNYASDLIFTSEKDNRVFSYFGFPDDKWMTEPQSDHFPLISKVIL